MFEIRELFWSIGAFRPAYFSLPNNPRQIP